MLDKIAIYLFVSILGVLALPKTDITPPSPVEIEESSRQQFTCSITVQTNWRMVGFYDHSDSRSSFIAFFYNASNCSFVSLSDSDKAIYEISCGTRLGQFHFTIKSVTKQHHNKSVECVAQYGTGSSSDIYVRDSTVIQVIIPLKSINISPDTSPVAIQTDQIKSFTCDATSRPLTNIIWKIHRNGQSIEDMAPHKEQVNGVTVTSILNYTGIEMDDKAVIFCIGQYNGSDIESTKVRLEIIYAPNTELSIHQVPALNIITGNIVTLTCKVSGGNPLPQLAWNCSGITRNNSAGNESSYSVMFTVDKSFNNRICTCYVSVHPVLSYRPTKQQLIVVFYQPNKTPIIQRSPASNIFAGQNITLLCTLSGGNPLPTLSWNCTGDNHKSTSGPNAFHSITFIVKAKYNNRICTCSATQLITAYQQHVDHTLVVYYAPNESLSIEKIPETDSRAGDNLTLICTVLGGNPLATLSWNCTGHKMNYNSGIKAESTVGFTVDKTYNNMICTCSASHPVTSYRPTIQYKLVVHYVPGTNPIILQTPPGGILTGNTVTLTCSVFGGNPLATLSWNCTGTKGNNTTVNTSSYSITLIVDKSYNNKICRCTASHLISTYNPNVYHKLVVYYAPSDLPSVQQTPDGGIIANHTVVLTCSVNGGNPLPILSWNCTGDMTNSTSDATSTSSVSFPVNKSHNKAICACSALHPDTSYTHVVQHSLDIYFSPDTNLTIQRTPAGGIISGKKVNLTCIASGGNPLASLSWNCSGINTNYLAKNTVSHSLEIEVDESDNNKLCTCSATHPYFKSYKPTVENRLLGYFKPFLDTSISNSTTNIVLSENDHLFITVSVKSNPHPTIKWTFLSQTNIYVCSNSVINSTSVNDGLHSSSNISIANLKKNQFGDYTFMATNAVGIFLRKFSVLGKEKPMPPSYVHVVCKSTTAVVIFKPTLIGNLPQELYIQYAVEGHDMTSIKVHMNDTNQAIEYTVTGLNSGRKHNFYILAVNLFGQTRSNQVKCLTDTLFNREDMLALNKDNSGMLSAGIASLVVGLLFFVAAVLFIFRKRFKKTNTKAYKSDEYSDLQTSNPAFQDPYTSIQNPIESRHHQESTANTYEECGNASDGAAYQNMKYGHKKEDKNLGIYDNMKI